MNREQRGAAGEIGLLNQIRGRVGQGRRGGVALGIGDDCALLRVAADEELAVTTDLSIAGRHFHLDWHPPEVVEHRALARGLSDLAAMGARPVAAFLSLGLPGELTKSQGRGRPWMERFYDGLLELAARHKVSLAGGDLAQSPVALADIVLVGAAPRGRALLRSGARPGDLLYVTGSLGGAAAGLELLNTSQGKAVKSRAGKVQDSLRPHLYPEPRVTQGLFLQRKGLATAALDISDGLSTDLKHLCDESRVRAEVDADALPIAAGATLEQALHGGEDYELLFTVAPETRMPRAIAGVPVTRIGRILPPGRKGPQVTIVTKEGPAPLRAKGWEHFS